jgi:hypothetical protein
MGAWRARLYGRDFMQTFRKPTALAARLHGSSQPHRHDPSPEQSATASSGTYRAVRPTEAETAAVARGESVIETAKIEGLRFELEVGIWRGDAEYIASRIVDDACMGDDAECIGGSTDDE